MESQQENKNTCNGSSKANLMQGLCTEVCGQAEEPGADGGNSEASRSRRDHQPLI